MVNELTCKATWGAHAPAQTRLRALYAKWNRYPTRRDSSAKYSNFSQTCRRWPTGYFSPYTYRQMARRGFKLEIILDKNGKLIDDFWCHLDYSPIPLPSTHSRLFWPVCHTSHPRRLAGNSSSCFCRHGKFSTSLSQLDPVKKVKSSVPMFIELWISSLFVIQISTLCTILSLGQQLFHCAHAYITLEWTRRIHQKWIISHLHFWDMFRFSGQFFDINIWLKWDKHERERGLVHRQCMALSYSATRKL